MGRRTWIKIYVDNWLRGSLRNESACMRGFFTDLVALAGDSAYGDDGIIMIRPNTGYTDEQLATILNVQPNEWLGAKSRFIATGRIKADKNNIITVTNWKKYQSEYRRQKQYRQNTTEYRAETKKVTEGSYTEKEKEKEKENIYLDNQSKRQTGSDQRTSRVKPQHVTKFTPAVLDRIPPKFRNLVAKKLGLAVKGKSSTATKLGNVDRPRNQDDGEND